MGTGKLARFVRCIACDQTVTMTEPRSVQLRAPEKTCLSRIQSPVSNEITNNPSRAMPHASTTIVRGPSVEDLVRSVCRIIHQSEFGLLASFKPSGHYPLLWAGPVRVSNDCRLARAQNLDLNSVFEVVMQEPDVVWAFPNGDGAEARLYGRMRLRAERAPELDDFELPLELTTSIVCISLEIPTHGISLMARLPDPLDRGSQPAVALMPGRSLQEAINSCLMTADWERN